MNKLLLNEYFSTWLFSWLKPMTDDPSSPSKKLVRETRTKNSVRMSCILARKKLMRECMTYERSFSCEFLVRVSWTENLGRLSWALVFMHVLKVIF